MRKYAIPTTFAVAAATLVVPFAQPAFSDEAAKPAEKCSITVESGTLDWGVKQSFRRYISGGIANGQWTTTGAVTEHGENKKGKDFFFQFQVDPAKSTITFDESGNVTAADIRTQDAAVDFEGHKGALASHIGSPYLTTTGTDAKIGINYRGYYVKGKGMAEYKPEDRIPENLLEGSDHMAGGIAAATVDGDHVTLKASGVKYQPKPGTDPWKGIIEGVDVVFLGMYDATAEMDDVNVTLKTKKTCVPVESEKPTKPTEAEKPTETAKPSETAKPTETPKPTTEPAPKSSDSVGFKVVAGILGSLGLLGLLGAIAHVLNQNGIAQGLVNQIRQFLGGRF